MTDQAQIPLFYGRNFENVGTCNGDKQRAMYPSRKSTSQKDQDDLPNPIQQFPDIEARVTPVLNAIDYHTGNIHRVIANDLASPAAVSELSLLPKLDYRDAQYTGNITDECKAMLRDKVKRYKRQHAHNLAVEGMVDIVIKWKCEPHGPQPVRMLPEKEFNYVQIAHKCCYKYLNWDVEHAEVKKHRKEEKRQPRRSSLSRRNEDISLLPPLPADHDGGFYACIIQDLLPYLENLSPAWTATVEVVVQPRLMTKEEQREMDEYHAVRRQAENAIKLQNRFQKLELERGAGQGITEEK